MKYCSHCGSSVEENTKFCPNCGASLENKETPINTPNNTTQKTGGMTTLQTIAFIFMIICSASLASVVVPLAWCIPMTIHYYNCCKQGRPVSTGFKVCTLLFVSLVSGILMLVEDNVAQ